MDDKQKKLNDTESVDVVDISENIEKINVNENHENHEELHDNESTFEDNFIYHLINKKNLSNPKVLLTLAICAVMLIVFIVHFPSLSSKALSFDDNLYLVSNNLVKNPGISSTVKFLTEVLRPSTVGGYYQPFAMISLMVDYGMGGSVDNLMPFHRTSLLLHMFNTCLIILILYLLFRNIWVSSIVGLIFGVHPLTVETIAWVGERKTTLAAFFALISILAYILYNKKSDKRFYYASVILYLCSLMSKPTSTTLPIALLLLDFWPLYRATSKNIVNLVIEKVPYFVIGIFSGIITYLSQKYTAGVITPENYSLLKIPYTICHNIIFYLYKIFLPFNLSSHYPIPDPMSINQPMILAGIIGTLILIPLLLISLRRTRALFTGWLIFFVIILPTMQIIGFTIVIASDKYAYLPAIGLLLALAWFFNWILEKISLYPHSKKIILNSVLGVLVLGSFIYESVLTRDYTSCWQTTEKLYKHMISLAPKQYLLYYNLGCALNDEGNFKDALDNYKKAISLNANFPGAYINIGNIVKKDSEEEALTYYKKALSFANRYPGDVAKAYYNIAYILESKKDYEGAIENYDQAIRLSPDFSDAYVKKCLILKDLNKLDDALEQLKKSLNANPNDPKVNFNIGLILAQEDDLQGAQEYYKKTLELDPESIEAIINLSDIFLKQKKYLEAEAYARQAIELNASYTEAYSNLGNALANQGKFEDAVRNYMEALRISPDNVKACYNIGFSFYNLGKYDEAVKYYTGAIKIDPSFENAYNNLGAALVKENKIDEAINNYKEMAVKFPKSENAHRNLGTLLQKKGDVENAKKEFDEVLKINPKATNLGSVKR